MRRWLWAFAIAGLGFGSLSMVGGTAIGGSVGPLAIGYGLLVVLTAMYLMVGLAVRDRVMRRQASRVQNAAPSIDRLAGHRVF